ncbi:type II toxin-antitoxin system RelE/ParE family toxin [Devosia sp. Root635]|uniref:type II toxin-antitoxin system RelE/ParE family toxin n=1 Tax=Devosia sp. Root635 TaxID=1736575 RepID=UPI0006F6A5C5|nr:type II toxin-antitoxin system RelE/ParE family toxin [Devosia sp. Root635]KRA45562.1 plasmid maintenance system killer [Devosia sp. Root635]
MIKSFKSKSLAELWNTGKSGKIDARMHKRLMVRLSRLDALVSLDELNLPGFDFHPLRGFDPARYTVHINGPWCVTFEFDGNDILAVDFEQYH